MKEPITLDHDTQALLDSVLSAKDDLGSLLRAAGMTPGDLRSVLPSLPRQIAAPLRRSLNDLDNVDTTKPPSRGKGPEKGLFARESTKSAAYAGVAVAQKTTPIAAAARVRTKGDVYRAIAGHTGIHRKQVAAIFQSLEALLSADLSTRGPGVVQVPGLMRITVHRRPATRARQGINPFTRESTVFKAKPARSVVKVRPMRGLKKLV